MDAAVPGGVSELERNTMKLRPFGNTGMNVSEVGLGAWQLANPDWGIDDKEEALKIIQKSLEAGCSFFDTAENAKLDCNRLDTAGGGWRTGFVD